jgi:methyltransferase
VFCYVLLILAVGVERIAELIVARRNLARSLARGGHEVGFAQYPFMVALHAGLLAGAVAEVWFGDRPFLPWLGWPMLAVVVAAQGLRWWCIRTLGSQWNTRIVVVPGAPRITSGPYRWLRHPNYVAVVAEGVALPLVHTAWITALTFTVLNAALLTVRIRVEDAALGELARADA